MRRAALGLLPTRVDRSIQGSPNILISGSQSSGLQEHLQTISEEGKEKLARALHDDLGALLVGAMMDLAWAEQNWDRKPEEIRAKVTRARHSLAAAIDYKRQLVENLRPSLLENVGLFAALRWHVKAACQLTGFECVVDLPDTELHLAPRAGIALFRIVQEAFALVCDARAGNGKLVINTDQKCFSIQIVGAKIGPAERKIKQPDYPLTTIRQRVAALGGRTTIKHPSSASTMIFKALVPLRNIVSHPPQEMPE